MDRQQKQHKRRRNRRSQRNHKQDALQTLDIDSNKFVNPIVVPPAAATVSCGSTGDQINRLKAKLIKAQQRQLDKPQAEADPVPVQKHQLQTARNVRLDRTPTKLNSNHLKMQQQHQKQTIPSHRATSASRAQVDLAHEVASQARPNKTNRITTDTKLTNCKTKKFKEQSISERLKPASKKNTETQKLSEQKYQETIEKQIPEEQIISVARSESGAEQVLAEPLENLKLPIQQPTSDEQTIRGQRRVDNTVILNRMDYGIEQKKVKESQKEENLSEISIKASDSTLFASKHKYNQSTKDRSLRINIKDNDWNEIQRPQIKGEAIEDFSKNKTEPIIEEQIDEVALFKDYEAQEQAASSDSANTAMNITEDDCITLSNPEFGEILNKIAAEEGANGESDHNEEDNTHKVYKRIKIDEVTSSEIPCKTSLRSSKINTTDASESSNRSKTKLKIQRKEAEKIERAMADLELIYQAVENRIPESTKKIIKYAQNINKKYSFEERFKRVADFFDGFQ